MFKLHKDYFRNGRGYHFKTILFSFLSTLILAAVLLILPATSLLFGFGIFYNSQDFYGNPSNAGIILLIISCIVAFILYCLLSIFVLLPLSHGIIQFYKNTDLGKQPRFRDLFTFFKKGKYTKTLKLIGLLLIIGVSLDLIITFIYSSISIIYNLFMHLLDPTYTEMMKDSIIISIVQTIVMIIAYIPIYYLMIYLMNVILVHIDQSSLPTSKKFSIAKKITTKGPNSAWKLLFANLLYFVIIFVVISIISIIAAMIVTFLIQNLSTIVGIILGVLFGIITLFISTMLSYLTSGSMVNFYHKNKNALYPTE